MRQGQQAELYNYQADGIGEVINRGPTGPAPDLPLAISMYNKLFNPTNGVVATELRQPLPAYLQAAQQRAMAAYLAYEAAAQGAAGIAASAAPADGLPAEMETSSVLYMPFVQP